MKKTSVLKKGLATLLSLILAVGLAVPAFAAEAPLEAAQTNSAPARLGAPTPLEPGQLDIITASSTLTVNGTVVQPGAPVSITGNSLIKLAYSWEMVLPENMLTNNIQPGEFSYIGTIPAALCIADLDTKTLQVNTKPEDDPSGQNQAYHIGDLSFVRSGDDWRIKLTYADEVQGLVNVRGNFDIESTIEYNKVREPGIVWEIGDGSQYIFNFPDKGVNTIEKVFSRSLDAATDETRTYKYDTFEWIVKVNRNSVANQNGKITDTITDEIKPDFPNPPTSTDYLHTFDTSTIQNAVKVFPVNVDPVTGKESLGAQLTNRITSGTPDADNGSYMVNVLHNRSIEVDLGEISGYYAVYIYTKVSYEFLSYNRTLYCTFANQAAVDGLDPVKATKGVAPVAPHMKGVFNPSNQDANIVRTATNTQGATIHYVEWYIDINRMGYNIDTVEVLETLWQGHKMPDYSLIVQNKIDAYSDIEMFDLREASLYPQGYALVSPTKLLDGLNPVNNKYIDNYKLETTPRPPLTASTSGVTQFSFDVHTKESSVKGYRLYIRVPVDATSNEANVSGLYNTATIQNRDYKAGGILMPGAVGPHYTMKQVPAGAVVDQQNRTMDWVMQFYSSNKTPTNFVIKDTFKPPSGADMSLIKDSLVVRYRSLDGSVDRDLTGLEYTLEYYDQADQDAGAYNKGFIVKMPGVGQGTYTITYKTHYNLKLGVGGTGTKTTFWNNMNMTWDLDNVNEAGEDKASQDVEGEGTLNGEKDGIYVPANGNAPARIDWSVSFNVNEEELGTNVTIKDTFSNGMVLDTNALVLYEMKKNPPNGAPTKTVVPRSKYTITPATGTTTTGFDIYLDGSVLNPNGGGIINKWYVIEYPTTLTEPILAHYTNEADVIVDGATLELDKTIDMDSDDKILAKTGVTDGTYSDNQTIYKWNVTINEKGKTFANDVLDPVFTDTLSAGLILLNETSYPITVTKNGVAMAAGIDYTLHFNDPVRDPLTHTTTFTIKFKDALLKTAEYKVEYYSKFDPNTAVRDPATNEGVLSNNARFTGSQVDVWKDVVTTQSFTSVTGGGEGAVVPLRIVKRDAADDRFLDGAEFALYAKASDGSRKLVAENITTTGGISKVFNLLTGTYIIKETKAPAGYSLSAPSEQEVIVMPPKNGEGPYFDVTFRNEKIVVQETLYTLVVRKTDAENGALLAGARFTVYDAANALKGTITVGADGTGTLAKKLPAGKYILVENVAPLGYDLPVNPRTEVTIAAGQATTTVTVTVENTKTPVTPPVPGPEPDPDPPVPPVPPRPPLVLVPNIVEPEAGERNPPVGVVYNPPAGTDGGGTPTGDGPALAPQDPPATQTPELAGIPLGGLDSVAWSLLNLIMSLIALFAAITLIVTLFKRRQRNTLQRAEDDEYEEEYEDEEDNKVRRNRLFVLRLPAILAGFIPGILFLILENIRLPMTWITRWTPLIGAFFIISMILVLIHFVVKRRAEDERRDEDEEIEGHYSEQYS